MDRMKWKITWKLTWSMRESVIRENQTEIQMEYEINIGVSRGAQGLYTYTTPIYPNIVVSIFFDNIPITYTYMIPILLV